MAARRGVWGVTRRPTGPRSSAARIPSPAASARELLPVGDAAFDLFPEAGGVVHLFEVRDFVGGDVVEGKSRRADEAPGEIQAAFGGA